MANPIDDTWKNLAQWMREVARGPRTADASRTPAESTEVVLEHLESRIGRKLSSSQAVDNFLRDLASEKSNAEKRGMRRGILRGTLLLGLLVAAFLNYYYWSVRVEIASMPTILVFVKNPSSR